jgi:hypothetical protein
MSPRRGRRPRHTFLAVLHPVTVRRGWRSQRQSVVGAAQIAKDVDYLPVREDARRAACREYPGAAGDSAGAPERRLWRRRRASGTGVAPRNQALHGPDSRPSSAVSGVSARALGCAALDGIGVAVTENRVSRVRSVAASPVKSTRGCICQADQAGERAARTPCATGFATAAVRLGLMHERGSVEFRREVAERPSTAANSLPSDTGPRRRRRRP